MRTAITFLQYFFRERTRKSLTPAAKKKRLRDDGESTNYADGLKMFRWGIRSLTYLNVFTRLKD